MLCIGINVSAEIQLSIRLNPGTTSGDGVVLIIRIRSVLSITIRSNTNTLFGLLFGRIQYEQNSRYSPSQDA